MNITNKQKKSDNFVRIAERRTRRVLDGIRLLEQCSNKRTYEYSDEQIKKIFREVDSAVKHAYHSFNTKRTNNNFKL